MPSRYCIGIDLGTSNCALSYVDTHAVEPRTQLLDVPQYEALGQWREDPVLPSFCYFLTDGEARELHPEGVDSGELSDWSRSRVVGLWAREMASLSPERVAFSAKSWLCHRGVDRESKLLPWQSTVLSGERKVSPVEASAAYLSYLRTVWDQEMAVNDKTARFDRQDIVVTVPASFDSDAQRLTLRAAEMAGYPASTRLLEEPQAAFYAWLERHPGAEELAAAFPLLNERPELVLVCDIGGGTSDFSLFEVTAPSEDEEQPSIRRLAVSEHILLGGDNLDLALAKMLEPQLAGDGGSLSTSAWAPLLSQCRVLKERVLAETSPDPEKILRVSVTEGGSSLFASARSAEITQAQVLELLLEGFFPECGADAKPETQSTGLREIGLPYAQDSAITRHLAGFLRGRRVDALLFNGGTVASGLLRDRLRAQTAAWQDGAEPTVLANDEPHLAVARGAAHYRASERAAEGLTISGGSGHAIYLEIEGVAPKKRRGKTKRKQKISRSGVCILSQGTEVETPLRLVEPELQLVVDRPVRLQAWTSPSRPEDSLGDVVDLDDKDFHRLPALSTLAQLPPDAPKPEGGKLAVHLIAELNNLGLLQVVCESVRRVGESQQRWALEFNLREQLTDEAKTAKETVDTGVASEDLNEARRLIRNCFALQSNSAEKSKPHRLIKDLEEALRIKRKEWNTALLRELWEPLGEAITRRDSSVEHELVWLMAAGFCLRPGYGAPFDEFRMQRLWFLHELGLAHEREKAIREQLFILWRRTAGGLSREQQTALYESWRARIFEDSKQAYEPLRMAGAMERLPSETRTELAQYCAQLILARADKYCDHAVWALGRLLNRAPLYGGEGAILPDALVAEIFDQLEPLTWRDNLSGLTTAFTQATRRLDHRDHDLSDALRMRILHKLRESAASEDQLRCVESFVPMEEKDRQQLFGESLPGGLHW